jgi:hypothetical protein
MSYNIWNMSSIISSSFVAGIAKAGGSARLGGLLLFLFLNSCTPMTGGPCSYEDHPLSAEIISLHLMQDGTCEIQFQPRPEAADVSHPSLNGLGPYHPIIMARANGKPIHSSWLEENGLVIGKQFTLIVSIIEKGTCTPVQYREMILPTTLDPFVIR